MGAAAALRKAQGCHHLKRRVALAAFPARDRESDRVTDPGNHGLVYVLAGLAVHLFG